MRIMFTILLLFSSTQLLGESQSQKLKSFLSVSKFSPGPYVVEVGGERCPEGELDARDARNGIVITNYVRFTVQYIGKKNFQYTHRDCQTKGSVVYKSRNLISATEVHCKGFSKKHTNIYMEFQESGKILYKYSQIAQGAEPIVYECLLAPDASGKEPSLKPQKK